ncbi:caspase family protein [Dactylosporangium sp. NPDC051541]|uniref:caspase, EACC1-associated type n=1 Tax=Dactylosporangium sp. NPDC051541 TaxID=3363977 RepID=UPI00379AE906
MLPSPERSSAVLVGTATYAHLDALPAVASNLERLRRLLTDPGVWGLPLERCHVLADPASTDDVLEAIGRGVRAAKEGFVFYYAGHGIPGPDTDELFLTIPRTNPDPVHGALAMADVRRVIQSGGGRLSRVVILDCCWSGRALPGAMSADTLAVGERLWAKGSYILTASSATRRALAPEGEPHTAFTAELLDVLDHGLPDGSDELTMASIYGHVNAALAAKNRPLPKARADDAGHAIVLARNRAAVLAPAATPMKPATSAEPGAEPVPPEDPEDEPLDGFEDALELEPNTFANLMQELRKFGRTRTRDRLLERTGRDRDTQEVAGIAHALDCAGEADALTHLLTGGARRPADEIAALADCLDLLDLTETADRLATRVDDERRIAALGRQLDDRRRQLLIDAALTRRAGDPPAMIRLIGALWTVDAPAIERALARISTAMAGQEAMALADALRRAGHDEPAFKLYLAATDAVLQRPAAEGIALASDLAGAGHLDQANGLLQKIVANCTDATRATKAFAPLRKLDLADDYLTALATHLDDEQIIATAAALRRDGHPDSAIILMQRAAAGGPADRPARYFAALFTAGRPRDAEALLQDTIRWYDGADLARLARDASTIAPPAFAARLVAAAAERRPTLAAELAAELTTAVPAEAALRTIALDRIAQAPPERLLGAILDLLGTDAARQLLTEALPRLQDALPELFPAPAPPNPFPNYFPPTLAYAAEPPKPPKPAEPSPEEPPKLRIEVQAQPAERMYSDDPAAERLDRDSRLFRALGVLLLDVAPARLDAWLAALARVNWPDLAELLIDRADPAVLHTIERPLRLSLVQHAAKRRSEQLLAAYEFVASASTLSLAAAFTQALTEVASIDDIVALAGHMRPDHRQLFQNRAPDFRPGRFHIQARLAGFGDPVALAVDAVLEDRELLDTLPMLHRHEEPERNSWRSGMGLIKFTNATMRYIRFGNEELSLPYWAFPTAQFRARHETAVEIRSQHVATGPYLMRFDRRTLTRDAQRESLSEFIFELAALLTAIAALTKAVTEVDPARPPKAADRTRAARSAPGQHASPIDAFEALLAQRCGN